MLGEHDLPAELLDGSALKGEEAVPSGVVIVCPLDVERRPVLLDGWEGSLVVDKVNLVHTGQGAKDLKPLLLAEKGAAWAFTDEGICGDADHQHVSVLAGFLDMPKVPPVEEVKHSMA